LSDDGVFLHSRILLQSVVYSAGFGDVASSDDEDEGLLGWGSDEGSVEVGDEVFASSSEESSRRQRMSL